jgi:hypothetical protein
MSTRKELLTSINAQLASRGLKRVRKLGDIREGEIEIVGLAEIDGQPAIYEHSKRFFTDVKFAVKFPNGTPGEFTVRYNAKGEISDGAVFVVVINGRIAIVKQWRLPLGIWTYEVPRGFGEMVDAALVNGTLGTLKIGDLPLGTLTRELGEEVMKDAEVSSITHLGNIAENSGTHSVTPAFYLVQLRVDEQRLADKLKGSDELTTVKLWDSKTVDQQVGHKICDCHSITALYLAEKHKNGLPK